MKLIEGEDKDLSSMAAKKEKQIFFYNSCSNEGHWAKTLRKRFPEISEKLVLGLDLIPLEVRIRARF